MEIKLGHNKYAKLLLSHSKYLYLSVKAHTIMYSKPQWFLNKYLKALPFPYWPTCWYL